jgi:Rieske [2Fe-2S] domain
MARTLSGCSADAAKGVYRVDRDIFTDPEIFELEMKHIFEGNSIYLAHESQIPNKNDYFTTYMGRQPIFIARSRDGELNAFINACIFPTLKSFGSAGRPIPCTEAVPDLVNPDEVSARH